MADELIQPSGYGDFLREVKAQIRERQYQALRAANKELLALYWWLGEAISRRQAEQGWGKAVVETLAHDLQAEFPGRNGFSAQSLWLMRQFYNEYATKTKLQPVVGEISLGKESFGVELWPLAIFCASAACTNAFPPQNLFKLRFDI